MAFLHTDVYDDGLNVLDVSVNELHICSAEPTDYANVSVVTLGNKTTPSIGAPADRVGGGREVTLASFSDGSITETGTASHYALVDTATTRLLASGSLSATQAVTSGNTFSVASLKIGIPGPVA